MKFKRYKKPDGYKELLVYRRTTELQDFVYKITEPFSWKENRRREHMRDSARSVKQNIVEGWKRETTQQYIDFLSYSFGSLGELKEDGEDCLKLNLITQEEFEELIKKCGEIDFLMGRLKGALERKISKEEVLSPYERWLGRKMEQEREDDKKFEEEITREFGLVRLPNGRMVTQQQLEREKREEGEKGG